MNSKNLITTQIICPHCKKGLKKKQDNLYFCHCSEHPFVDNILCFYYPSEKTKSQAIEFIKSNKLESARKILAGKKYYYLFKFLNIFFQNQEWKQKIAIVFLVLLVPDGKKWFKYLFFRKKNVTYYTATQVCKRYFSKVKSGIFVDFGSGTGEILNAVYALTQFTNYIGVDLCYQHLFFLNNVYFNPNQLLICCDLSKRFPMKNNSIRGSMTTETINYMEDIPRYLNQLYMVTLNNGVSILTSVHNKGFNIPSYTISPEEILKALPHKFSHIILSDADISVKLQQGKTLASTPLLKAVNNSSFSLILKKHG